MIIDSKVKKDMANRLSEFYNKALLKDDFIDLELLNIMREITAHTGFEVAVLINRKGIVEDIFVGNSNSVSIPKQENNGVELNGVRVVHTHPNGDSTLSALDKSLLINERFDAVCAVGVSEGKLTTAGVGFINGGDKQDKVDIAFVPNAEYINKYGLFEKLHFYNDILKQKKSKIIDNDKLQDRAILVCVELEKEDNAELDLEELEALSETAKVKVVGKLTQKRAKPDGRYLIGEGKLEELKHLVQNESANLVIFDNELTGSKMANLSEALGVKIITRSMLILDIFAGRAKTNEGKLQVELAQLKYLLPRVGSMIRGHEGSGSGVGMRGPGESKLEINRRIIEKSILQKEKELENVKKNREVARVSRKVSSKKIVSLVGYTNSGKSTLMNTLSGANVYEKDELFATLDTTTRNVYLDEDNYILLIDTVGFINKLPHELINAFSSTLEESVQADLLLHVVDISHKTFEKQMQVVENVLKQIKANSPIITVINKIDKVANYESKIPQGLKDYVCISAKKGTGLDQLKQIVIEKINNI